MGRTSRDKERHMFYVWIYFTLAVVLTAACHLLYKVTYPACTSRRCNHRTN